MASEAKGIMYVPVWVDGGIVKVLVNDDGQIPVKESSPLTNIQARLYGFDDPDWIAVPTETDGSLRVHLESYEGTLLIQQYMPSLLQPGVNAYIDGSWQKQPLVWGYSDRWFENLDYTTTATYATVKSTAVPTGYVYVLEAAALLLLERATTSASIELRPGGAAGCPLQAAANLGANTWMFWEGRATLEATDQVQLYVNGCQVGDTFSARVWGHMMRIDL